MKNKQPAKPSRDEAATRLECLRMAQGNWPSRYSHPNQFGGMPVETGPTTEQIVARAKQFFAWLSGQ